MGNKILLKNLRHRLSWLLCLMAFLAIGQSAWAAYYLAGSFNGWGADEMTLDTDGYYKSKFYYCPYASGGDDGNGDRFKVRASNSDWNTTYWDWESSPNHGQTLDKIYTWGGSSSDVDGIKFKQEIRHGSLQIWFDPDTKKCGYVFSQYLVAGSPKQYFNEGEWEPGWDVNAMDWDGTHYTKTLSKSSATIASGTVIMLAVVRGRNWNDGKYNYGNYESTSPTALNGCGTVGSDSDNNIVITLSKAVKDITIKFGDSDSKVYVILTPVPHYIKHPWGGGDWSWQEMTSNGDGTYTYEGEYGGTGCNWNTSASETGKKWIGSPNLVGCPESGDDCYFTLNPTEGDDGSITITNKTSGKCRYYIKNSWDGGDWTWQEMIPNGDKSEWSYTGIFGGDGCNINTKADDTGSEYFSQGNITGNPQTGTEYTFIYNVAGKTLRAESTCTAPTADGYTLSSNSFTYSGSGQAPTVSPETGYGTPTTIKYGTELSSATTTKPTNVGTYHVYITGAASGDYCAYTDLDLGTFSINKADQSALTFNGSTQCVDTEVTLSATGGSSGETITYTKKNGVGTVTGDKLTSNTAGDVEVTATRPGGTNYNDVSADATFTFTAHSTATTGDASGITTTSADLAGTISAVGDVTAAGFAISTTSGSGYTNYTGTIDGSNVTLAKTELSANTTYYYKAYVTDGCGTYYGTERSFKTLKNAPADLYIKGPLVTGDWSSYTKDDVGYSHSGNVYTFEFEATNAGSSDNRHFCISTTNKDEDKIHSNMDATRTGWNFASGSGSNFVASDQIVTGSDIPVIITVTYNAANDSYTMTLAEAGVAPVRIKAIRDRASFNANDATDFVALYPRLDATQIDVDNISAYKWEYSSDNSNWSDYTAVATLTGESGTTDNIRVRTAGYYRLTVTQTVEEVGTDFTSDAFQVTSTSGSTKTFCSNLPVICVRTSKDFPTCSQEYASQCLPDMKEKITCDVQIYWNGTDAATGLYYDRKARLNYRGSSSLNFTKKSYAFVCGDANTKGDGNGTVKTAKLKMFEDDLGANAKDWVLYAAFPDVSMMRNKITYDTYSEMTGLWAPKSRYVELYVDGDYKGVYVFMDKITQGSGRVEVDKNTGYIFKFDKTDTWDRFDKQNPTEDDKMCTFMSKYSGRKDIESYNSHFDQMFEIEYPEREDDPANWSNKVEALQNKINKFEEALKDKDWETVRSLIDYQTWADWFIINEFTKNADAYRASNLFTLNDIDGKIKASPIWDYELGLDNYAQNFGKDRHDATNWLYSHTDMHTDIFPIPFWIDGVGSTNNGTGTENRTIQESDNFGGLLDDPCFVSMIKSRWALHTAANAPLSTVALGAKLSACDAVLTANGTCSNNPITREVNKWPLNGRGQAGYEDMSSHPYITQKTELTDWFSSRNTGMNTLVNALDGGNPITVNVDPISVTKFTPVSLTATTASGSAVSWTALSGEGSYLVNTEDHTVVGELPLESSEVILKPAVSGSITVSTTDEVCGAGEISKTVTITVTAEEEQCD